MATTMVHTAQPKMGKRDIPFWWAITFVIVSVCAAGAVGFLVGHLLAEAGAPNTERYLVDVREIKVPGEIPVWQIRWLEYGQAKIIQIEGTDDKDRLVNWLGRR